jgi:hypothetical protein
MIYIHSRRFLFVLKRELWSIEVEGSRSCGNGEYQFQWYSSQ